MNPEDVEAIERATLAAVSPAETLEAGGWLAGFDPGTIGRAKSAAPLRHDLVADVPMLQRLEAEYRARGLVPSFRMADVDGLQDVRAKLSTLGYAPTRPTLVKVGNAAGLAALAPDAAELVAAPDEDWGAVFLGEGFDPADGAHRVAALSRSPDAVYGQVRARGRTVAVGVAAFGFGWASIHGMRTDHAHRRQGLAGRILAALARAALARGFRRIFLQVEEGNAPARALYRRAGLAPAWRYHHWRH